MTALRIVFDADNQFPEMRGNTKEGEIYAITSLEGGMVSGKPSVGIIVQLPDKSFVFTQCSMANFLVAARAFQVRYEDNDKPRTPNPN